MLSIAQAKNNNVFHIGSYAILCVLLPALVVASAFLLEQNVMYILLAAPAIVAIVYRLPHLALIAMSLSVMFVESLHFNLGLLPRQVTWIGDAVILLIAARALIFGKAKIGRAQDPFGVPLLLFGAVFLCSVILNSVSLTVTLVTIRQYFKYVILYLAITGLPLSSKHISQSLRFLFFLILAQVPIVFVAFLMGARADSLSGGMGEGGTAPLGFLCIAAANIFISRYIHSGRLLDLVKFAAVSTVPAMSEIKFGIIILPVSIICTILLALSTQRRRAFITLAVSVPLLLGAVIAYSSIYPETFERFGSWSFWSGYMHQEYEAENLQGGIYLGRAARMRVAASHVTGHFDAAVVGVGPGETGDSFFDAGKGSLYDTVLGAASQLEFTRVLLELGIPGIMALMWIMVRLPRGLAGLYRVTAVVEDKALICGLFGTSVISILYAFYMPVLSYADPTAYLFWVSAAFLSVSMSEMRVQHTS